MTAKEITSPVKAIRAKCLECSCDFANDVRTCRHDDCALWPYRFGKNPARKGIVNKGSFTSKTTAQLNDRT